MEEAPPYITTITGRKKDHFFLRLYAKAYLERNANLLLDHLSPLLLYSRQSPHPQIMEKHSFVEFLNGRFLEQKRTSDIFYGILKLVQDDKNRFLLYMQILNEEIIFFITTENNLITRIDVEKIEDKKLTDIELLFHSVDYHLLRNLKLTREGDILIEPDNDPDEIMKLILKTGYKKENCAALSFDKNFISKLMSAGFIVMTLNMRVNGIYRLAVIPTHHKVRSVIKTKNIHIKKTIKKHLNKYILKFDCDFEEIVNKCKKQHGSILLSEQLINVLHKIRNENIKDITPVSFGVYRDGELKAGEFGILTKNIYTSYSGYHDENNSGTVQMVLTAEYLKNKGFEYWDLGMPMRYKDKLGAEDIKLAQFLEIFHRVKKNEVRWTNATASRNSRGLWPDSGLQ
jgi:leucyl/phenylalanyl-tRNA--protein transferase